MPVGSDRVDVTCCVCYLLIIRLCGRVDAQGRQGTTRRWRPGWRNSSDGAFVNHWSGHRRTHMCAHVCMLIYLYLSIHTQRAHLKSPHPLHMYREAALVFNSGYDLNLGLLAAITRPGDAVLFDELVRFYPYCACLFKERCLKWIPLIRCCVDKRLFTFPLVAPH